MTCGAPPRGRFSAALHAALLAVLLALLLSAAAARPDASRFGLRKAGSGTLTMRHQGQQQLVVQGQQHQHQQRTHRGVPLQAYKDAAAMLEGRVTVGVRRLLAQVNRRVG